MILESHGEICDDIYAIGVAALPAYLVVGDTPALFDAGMTFMGPIYLEDLRTHLGDENGLCFNFLTHSHFDHAGAAPYLKRKIIGLQIGAHPLAAETFAKPKAIDLIRNLSRNFEMLKASAIVGENVLFSDPDVDIFLEDGMEIDLGQGLIFRTITTPGHTKDAVSFFIPARKALIVGEAAGTLDKRMNIQPAFLSSYRNYMASLEKLASLDIDLLMLGHNHALTGEDARTYIGKSMAQAEAFQRRIANYLDELHGDQDAVVQRFYREDFEEAKAIQQAVRPYLINMAAKVKVVAEDR